MEIEGKELQESDKGAKVTYIPRHADGADHPDVEGGVITSWNDKFVFVEYGTGTPKGTPAELLVWG